jgi:hypothetical protein
MVPWPDYWIDHYNGQCSKASARSSPDLRKGSAWPTAKRFAAAGCNVVINGFGDERDIAAMRAQIEKEHGVRTMYSGANLAHASRLSG